MIVCPLDDDTHEKYLQHAGQAGARPLTRLSWLMPGRLWSRIPCDWPLTPAQPACRLSSQPCESSGQHLKSLNSQPERLNDLVQDTALTDSRHSAVHYIKKKIMERFGVDDPSDAFVVGLSIPSSHSSSTARTVGRRKKRSRGLSTRSRLTTSPPRRNSIKSAPHAGLKEPAPLVRGLRGYQARGDECFLRF